MSDSTPDPAPVEQAPAPAESAAAPPVEEPAAAPPPPASDEPATDDPVLNQQIADQAIAVPDGDKLVPESLLRNVAINYRNKLKEAKQGSPEAVALRQQLDATEARLREAEPLAQAFRAMQQATPAPQPPAPTEDVGELQDIAKDFDFYTADGQPDLDRARRYQTRLQRTATQIAQRQTAPLITHALSAQAQHNIARMKATAHPVTGLKADPRVIDVVVSQLAQQEGGLATLANIESVKHLWSNAYAMSTFDPAFGNGASHAAATPPATPAPTPPVVTERAGGATTVSTRGLSTSEKRAAKDAGLTEKQYLDIAAGMKWGLLIASCLIHWS